MKQEFIIKMQGKQFEKGRAKIFFMLLCFVVAMIILMVYSSKFFIALLAPIFLLLFRLKTISSEKKFITDVICEVECKNNGIDITLRSTQSRLCNMFFIDYKKVQEAQFTNNGKIIIVYYDFDDKKNIWEFIPMDKDHDFWKQELRKFNF